jgi:hypothetical protein
MRDKFLCVGAAGGALAAVWAVYFAPLGFGLSLALWGAESCWRRVPHYPYCGPVAPVNLIPI